MLIFSRATVGMASRVVFGQRTRRMSFVVAARSTSEGLTVTRTEDEPKRLVGKLSLLRKKISSKRQLPDTLTPKDEENEKLHSKKISTSTSTSTSTPTSVSSSGAFQSIPTPPATMISNENKLSTTSTFSSLAVSANTKKAIETVMKYTNMTPVQDQSIPHVLDGKDVFVKAKTGTGKTLAFLIPSIEVLIRDKTRHAKAMRSRDVTKSPPVAPVILVLSPTRELAAQIADEAKTLCSFHKFEIVTLFGGTNMDSDVKRLNQPRGVDIIVATPGRLLAHLQETNGFARRCGQGISVLILDECDRLLDMGFSKDINKIMNFLKPSAPTRQTLLFSATTTDNVKEIAASTLKPGYSSIDTVGEEQEQTHSHVPQRVTAVPQGQQLRALASLIHKEVSENPRSYKIMVFFATARQAAFASSLFNQANINVLEIHSRKTQGHRTRTSDTFRAAQKAILFSSDVTARGLDYPDVTLVIQVGMTTREQYIHRLGRTARAGKSGSGVLLLAPFESRAMKQELYDLPMEGLQLPPLSGPAESVNPWITKLESVLKGSVTEEAEESWAAWLGFYNSMTKKIGWNKEGLVQASIDYALSIGLPTLPPIPRRTLAKMGLVNVEGLNVVSDTPRDRRGGAGGRGGGGGRGGESNSRGSSRNSGSSIDGVDKPIKKWHHSAPKSRQR